MEKKDRNLILLFVSPDSLKSSQDLMSQIKNSSLKNYDIKFFNSDEIKKIDFQNKNEPIHDIVKTRSQYKEVAIINMDLDFDFFTVVTSDLFEEKSLVLLIKETNLKDRKNHLLYKSKKFHLEIELKEVIYFLDLFFLHPDDVLTFYNHRHHLVREIIKLMFEQNGLKLDHFKYDFIFKSLLYRAPLVYGKRNFSDYLSSLEENSLEMESFYNSLNLHRPFLKEDFPLIKETLFNNIMPEIIKKGIKDIKIEVLAAGGGYECTLLSYILKKYIKENNLDINFKIFAKESYEDNYKVLMFRPVKKVFFDQYKDHFVKEELIYQKANGKDYFKEEYKEEVVYSKGSFIDGPFLLNSDIVISLDKLNHIKEPLKEKFFKNLTFTLKENSFFIGSELYHIPQGIRSSFKESFRGAKFCLTLIKAPDMTEISQFVSGQLGNVKEQTLGQIKKSALNKSRFKTDSKYEYGQKDDIINDLKKQLSLAKTSLSAATMSYEQSYKDQVHTLEALKRANKELSEYRDNLIRMVEERTKELKESNESLKKREAELKNSNELLENVQEDRSLFFAKLSHELRTPLNSILGFSEILKSELKRKNLVKEQDFISCIKSSGDSLLSLIDSVMDFTKIDLNQLKVENTNINFFEFLKDLSIFYTNQCLTKGIDFTLEWDEEVPEWVTIDKQKLKQVLDNLLGNALKFTEKGSIKVDIKSYFFGTTKKTVDLIFNIEDTGIGIEKEKLGSLFKSFSQVHSPESNIEKGTGLGLYISKQIVEKLNGNLLVSSQFGKGTNFSVTLKDVSLGFEEETIGTEKSYTFFGQTILIADDVHMNLTLLKAYLFNYDLNIETARDGEELLYKVNRIKPDLIVTDFKMPVLSGDKVMNTLKDQKNKTPVILISALNIDFSIQQEFDSFLRKPVQKDEFVFEVSKFLKHEVKKVVKEVETKVNILEFTVSKDLGLKEGAILFDMEEVFKEGLEDGNIDFLEKQTLKLQQKIKNNKLKYLSPWFDKINEEIRLFKIHDINNMLQDALSKIKVYKKSHIKDKAS